MTPIWIAINPNSSTTSYSIVPVIWEQENQKNFNLKRFYKTYSSEEVDKLFMNTFPRYYRGMVIVEKNNIFGFIWSGDVSHEDLNTALDKNQEKLNIPHYSYLKLYTDARYGRFYTPWLFPIVFDEGQLRANLNKASLEKLEQFGGVKTLGLSSSDWETIKEESW